MTDTTAALRMACAIMRTSIQYPDIATRDQDESLRSRLANHHPWSPSDTHDYGPLLLRWAAYDSSGRMTAILQALLNGTPTHAPGMSGLDVLKFHPGQEAREQAKELNNND